MELAIQVEDSFEGCFGASKASLGFPGADELLVVQVVVAQVFGEAAHLVSKETNPNQNKARQTKQANKRTNKQTKKASKQTKKQTTHPPTHPPTRPLAHSPTHPPTHRTPQPPTQLRSRLPSRACTAKLARFRALVSSRSQQSGEVRPMGNPKVGTSIGRGPPDLRGYNKRVPEFLFRVWSIFVGEPSQPTKGLQRAPSWGT